LGSQPRQADPVLDFLETDQLIPFIEGVIRVFDRYGERAKRMKARMKFLVKDMGTEAFLQLVRDERKALAYKTYPIDFESHEARHTLPNPDIPAFTQPDGPKFKHWKQTNVFVQKQKGYVSIGIKVHLGDFYTDKARQLADLIKTYANNEIRFTLRQNILIRDVKEELVPFFYQELKKLGMADYGYNTLGDITACPGTDTCNLGISSSTGAAVALEEVIVNEYPQHLFNKDLTIKISGCMNACGQHNMASIGFQGMSMKVGRSVVPALQVLLGGGTLGNGAGKFADKVIKIPSKRGPDALRVILDDFEKNIVEGETFLDYYDRKGQLYFYDILKSLGTIDDILASDFIDWGNEQPYVKAIGVGECAGVVIDLVSTLLLEAREKMANAEECTQHKRWPDSIYHSYAAMLCAAKAVLLTEGQSANSYWKIIEQFDEVFVESGKINLGGKFADLASQINQNEPTEEFAGQYYQTAEKIYHAINEYRSKEVMV